jgi:hypothetical protein
LQQAERACFQAAPDCIGVAVLLTSSGAQARVYRRSIAPSMMASALAAATRENKQIALRFKGRFSWP